MSLSTIKGNNIASLDMQIQEHVVLNNVLDLYIGLDREPRYTELEELSKYLSRNGIEMAQAMEIGTGEWPDTVHIQMHRPSAKLNIARLLSAGLSQYQIIGWSFNIL